MSTTYVYCHQISLLGHCNTNIKILAFLRVFLSNFKSFWLVKWDSRGPNKRVGLKFRGEEEIHKLISGGPFTRTPRVDTDKTQCTHWYVI